MKIILEWTKIINYTILINYNYTIQARVTKQSYRMELQDKFTKELMNY